MPSADPSFSLMSAGQTVYVACVIVANLTILNLTNKWTYWGELIMLLSIFSFYPIMTTMTEFTLFPTIYKLMFEFLSSFYAWLGLFLSVSTIMLGKMCKNEAGRMYKLIKIQKTKKIK